MVNQLLSIRASIDACLFILEEEGNYDDEVCRHPYEHRIDLSTMGGKDSWKCKVCGYIWVEGEKSE